MSTITKKHHEMLIGRWTDSVDAWASSIYVHSIETYRPP